MAGKQGAVSGAETGRRKLVRKRRGRSGLKRVLNLSLLAEQVLWVERRAVEGLTTPAEIVADLIEEKMRRMGPRARPSEAAGGEGAASDESPENQAA